MPKQNRIAVRTAQARFAAILSLLCAFAARVEPAPPTTGPSSKPLVEALPPGWEQVDERIVFLTVELATCEASLNAIDKAIIATGYHQKATADRAQSFRNANESMDRKGGGPIPWEKFYGTTAANFYYHSSASLNYTNGPSRAPAKQLQVSANGKDLTPVDRPPQFDYIYRANSDARARAEAEAARLGQQVDKLLARRRQLEAEQDALWCRVSFRAVISRDLTAKPVYAFEPANLPDADARRKQTTDAVIAGRDFFRIVIQAIDRAQDTVTINNRETLSQLSQLVVAERARLSRALLKLPLLAPELQNPASSIALFNAACKRLDATSRNLADASALAAESDQAGDEQRKTTLRGQVQSALIDFAQTTLTADSCLSAAAKEWNVEADTSRLAPEVSLPAAFDIKPAPPSAPAPSSSTTTPPSVSETIPDRATSLASPIAASAHHVLVLGGNREEKFFHNFGSVTVVTEPQTVPLLADANALSKATIIVWGINRLRNVPAADLNESNLNHLKSFVENGGELVIFEQYRQTNMFVLEPLFGIKAEGPGKRGSQIPHADLKAKMIKAGYTDATLAEIPSGDGFSKLPPGSTVLARSADGRIPVIAVSPISKGRVILIGNDAGGLQHKLDELVIDILYSPKPSK